MNAEQSVAPTDLASEVEEQIYLAIRKVADVGDTTLALTTNLIDLGLTSLEIVTVTFELEDHYDIEIVRQYLDDFATVREVRDTVVTLVQESRA